MKKMTLSLLLIITPLLALACPVCERNQPKILKGVTHSSNPDSNWDYVIVAVIGIITLLTLIYSIKYFVKPNESNADHIKYSFLNESKDA